MAFVLDLAPFHVSDPRAPALRLDDRLSSMETWRRFDVQLLKEGRLPPDEAMPARIYQFNKSKLFPGLFNCTIEFFIVTEIGRQFFETHAPHDVRFLPVEIFNVKFGRLVDVTFFWAIFSSRRDSIDFERSALKVVWFREFYKLGYGDAGVDPRWGIVWDGKSHTGLVSRVSDRHGSQVWREDLKGSNYSYPLFLSNELADAMLRHKICVSPTLIPVMDIA